MARCFKCEAEIKCASLILDKCFKGREELPANEKDIWSMPNGAVHFQGGSNFGSSIYDSMMDGIAVEVIICDPCLAAAKGTDKLREITVPRGRFS